MREDLLPAEKHASEAVLERQLRRPRQRHWTRNSLPSCFAVSVRASSATPAGRARLTGTNQRNDPPSVDLLGAKIQPASDTKLRRASSRGRDLLAAHSIVLDDEAQELGEDSHFCGVGLWSPGSRWMIGVVCGGGSEPALSELSVLSGQFRQSNPRESSGMNGEEEKRLKRKGSGMEDQRKKTGVPGVRGAGKLQDITHTERRPGAIPLG